MTETEPRAEHTNLTAALAAFQATLPRVNKTKTAKVPTKNGGSYSYTYADLSDVSAAVLPALAAQGLAWTCILGPNDSGSGMVLRGQLRHTSGEALDCQFPLASDITPQALGGNITYGRRYLLCSITGVAADEDNDAAGVAPEVDQNRRDQRRGEARSEVRDQRAEQERRIAENTRRIEREQAAEQARRQQDADAETPPPSAPGQSDPDAVLEVAHAIETASADQLRAAWDLLGRNVKAHRINPADEIKLRADWTTRKDAVLRRFETATAAKVPAGAAT